MSIPALILLAAAAAIGLIALVIDAVTMRRHRALRTRRLVRQFEDRVSALEADLRHAEAERDGISAELDEAYGVMAAMVVERDRLRAADPFAMVRAFHVKFGQVDAPTPDISQNRNLRLSLIDEELRELRLALLDDDIVGVADALADLTYVVIGSGLQWGIPLDRVLAEVHRSNMTKEGGGKRADGKILKGPAYEPPDIAGVLYGCSSLDACFDGELSTAQADAFRGHLATCERCQRALHGRMQENVVVNTNRCDDRPEPESTP